jgi:GTP pyrophosphokinase
VVSEKGLTFEVQIRTQEMHRIAEEGIAAHWKYKEGKVVGGKDEDALRWLRHLVEWHQEVSDNRDFMDAVRVELYPDEVYAFTPKGDIMNSARATPSISHIPSTPTSARCVGARVNGKLVTPRQAQERDIVEILTQANHTPAATGWDRQDVPRAQQDQAVAQRNERVKAIELAGNSSKTARRYKVNVKKVLKRISCRLCCRNTAQIEDLYSAIGYGRYPRKSSTIRSAAGRAPRSRPCRGPAENRVSPRRQEGVRHRATMSSGMEPTTCSFIRPCRNRSVRTDYRVHHSRQGNFYSTNRPTRNCCSIRSAESKSSGAAPNASKSRFPSD